MQTRYGIIALTGLILTFAHADVNSSPHRTPT